MKLIHVHRDTILYQFILCTNTVYRLSWLNKNWIITQASSIVFQFYSNVCELINETQKVRIPLGTATDR